MINLEQTERKKNMFDHIQPNPLSVLHNASYQLSSILIAWKYLQQDIITYTAAKLTKTNQGRWRGSGLIDATSRCSHNGEEQRSMLIGKEKNLSPSGAMQCSIGNQLLLLERHQLLHFYLLVPQLSLGCKWQ